MLPEVARMLWLITIGVFGLVGMFFWARSIYKKNRGRSGWIISGGSFDGDSAIGSSDHSVGLPYFIFHSVFLTFLIGVFSAGLGMIVGALMFQWAIPSGSF